MTHRLLPALVLLLLATACAERDPVEALIESVVQAADDRDADNLDKLLAKDFTAGDGTDRESALRTARQMFAAYKALDLQMSGLEINRRGPAARAKFRLKLVGVGTDFAGLGDLVPKTATYDVDVTARDEDGDWKLVTASWTVPAE